MEGVLMKKLSVLFVLILLLAVGGMAHAVDIASGERELQKTVLEQMKEVYPDAEFIDLSLEEYEALIEERVEEQTAQSEIGTFAAAPPVTGVSIVRVRSGNGVESVGNKTRTSPVRGQVIIETIVDGYGSDTHYFGGFPIRKTDPNFTFSVQGIDYNGDRIIDAFRHEVSFNSDTQIGWGSSRQYKLEARSHNSPFNTMSDSITIVHE